MTTLVARYDQQCAESGFNPQTFDPKNYIKALTTTVEELYLEDASHHGRLEEVKKLVTEFEDSNLGIEQQLLGKFTHHHSEIYHKITGKADEEGVKQMRKKYAFYPDY